MKYLLTIVAVLAFNVCFAQDDEEDITPTTPKTSQASVSENNQNAVVIEKLRKAGDNTSKPRRVEYWLYFRTEEDRTAFIEQVAEQKFRVENTGELKDDPYPHSLKITKVSDVELRTINSITSDLRAAANKNNGELDGWGCEMAK
jgi:hypothetical protein